MLYEIKLKLTKPDEKTGEVKEVKEHYIVEAELHADAEKTGYELYPNTDVDVFAVFRSDLKEIANDKPEDKPFYKATVVDTFIDDNGKEKELRYQLLVCASDLLEATAFMTEYLKQGYDMRLDAIRRTKIVDYIHD